MARDLKKFVNGRFIRTIDLGLMRRLLDRHADALHGLDLSLLNGDPGAARQMLQEFFAGPEEGYPKDLLIELHAVAELGTATGQQILLEQARRQGVPIQPANDNDSEALQEPKQFALYMFLEHHVVFRAAADTLTWMNMSSPSEFDGVEEGVEAELDDETKASFKRAAAQLFEVELRGRYCHVGWYEDGGELHVVVKHGAPLKTTEVIEDADDRVITIREAEHAVLSYSSLTGRLKVGGFAKSRRAELADAFAGTILRRPGFFSAPDAQDLYTLAPVERAGFGFVFEHAFDPGIRRVQITEVQADRIGTDPRSGQTRTLHSHVTRDGRENALTRMREDMPGISLGHGWRLNHLTLRVHFDVGDARPVTVTVKIKPPRTAMFKRHRFEDRIMTLLRRNGLINDRAPVRAAAAAE